MIFMFMCKESSWIFVCEAKSIAEAKHKLKQSIVEDRNWSESTEKDVECEVKENWEVVATLESRQFQNGVMVCV